MRAATHLMFQGDLPEALDLYGAVLPGFAAKVTGRDDMGRPVSAEATLAGHALSFFNSPPVHDFTFTPAMSLFLHCDSADEVDRLATALAEGGKVMMPLDSYDFAPRFAWVQDRFGVSWQVIQAA